MAGSIVYVKPDTLRSRLAGPALVLYALAAILGIPGIVLFFSPDYTQVLLQNMARSGITNPASQQSWMLVNRTVTTLSCLCPAVMAAGLLITRKFSPVRGIGLLSAAAQGLLWFVSISGGMACLVFVFRFLRYITANLTHPSGLMAIYSMIVSEALMAVQAAFLFVMIRRFLNACIDSATSIAYTLATSRLDDRSIPGFSSTGFLILAIVGITLAADRMFTVTAVINVVQSYYALLICDHPGIIAESVCLIFGAAANFLMHRILKSYKQKTEQALYKARYTA